MPEEDQVIPVKVALRCRPLIPKEVDEGCQTCLSFIPGEPQVILGANKSFTYDYVFTPDTPQNEVYDNSCASLVNGIFKGYNATVLAYGQTGSGKTFSMGGGYGVSIDTDESLVGIIPRVIRSLFEGIKEREDFNFSVKVSYLEIYKEDLMDLLVPVEKREKEKDSVAIREDTGGIRIAGLTEQVVRSVEDTMLCLENGSHSRTVAATAMNNSSSRSHAIFTMHIERTNKNDSQDYCRCKFHLVDLAGSERQKKTRAEGERLKEGININKGLLALGNVISALGDEAQRSKHVPYRDSKLTRLLQDSLGGNSHTVMIACVSPADSNMEETLSTLRYADRARKIKNKPIVNRDPQVAEILRLRQLVGDLQGQLHASGKPILKRESGGSIVSDSEDLRAIREKNKALTEQNLVLQQELEQAWEQNQQHCTRIIVLESRKDALQEKLDALKDKLESLNKDTPEGEEVAKVVKEMIKQLMEQIDDIERTQNENFDNYLQSINESQDGSNSDSEQTQLKQDTSDDQPKPDSEKRTEEMKQEYSELMAQRNRDLGELNKMLHLKMSRMDDIKQSSEMYDKLKGEFEENIKKLNGQIENLQHEKGSLETQLQQNKVVATANKVNENRRKRIHELEAEVSKKKKEISDANRMLKMKEQTLKDSEKLANEIRALKVQRVQLMKQMKADGEHFRKFKQQKDKEVLQLKAKERKRQVEITKLERQNAQQKSILKRKNEESLALTRRLNQALMKQKKVMEERVKKDETQAAIKKGAMVKKSLLHELEIMIGLQEAKEHKEGLVQDRADITKHIKKLRGQLVNGAPSSKRKMLNDSTEKDTDEETLKIQKEIRELENDMALKNSNINELSSKILEIEGDANEKLKRARFQDIKTLVDARIGLNYLLQIASAAKIEHRKDKTDSTCLKESIEELTSQIENLEREMENQRKQHENDSEKLQFEHDKRIVFMLKQMQTRNTDTTQGLTNSITDKTILSKLKFQEEEINRLARMSDSVKEKEHDITELKKQVTRLTYNSRCMKTSLMPEFSDTKKADDLNASVSFFSPILSKTDPILPGKTIDVVEESIEEEDEVEEDDEVQQVEEDDEVQQVEEDDDDDEDEEEDNVIAEVDDDEEWLAGYTPGYARRTISHVPKKLQHNRLTIPREIHSTLNISSKSNSPGDTGSDNNLCGCKGLCNTKRCKCQKLGSNCNDLCDCSSDKCTNREQKLPQSSINDDDHSQSNMNVTFVKDVSSTNNSTLDSSSDLFRDTVNSNRSLDASKNKRSLDTSNEVISGTAKYRKSGDAKRENAGPENSEPKVSDNGVMAVKQKKRKLGTKRSRFFQPLP